MSWKEQLADFIGISLSAICAIPPIAIIFTTAPQLEVPGIAVSSLFCTVLLVSWWKARQKVRKVIFGWFAMWFGWIGLMLTLGLALIQGWDVQLVIVLSLIGLAITLGMAIIVIIFTRRVNRRFARVIDAAGAELDGETFFYDGQMVSIEVNKSSVLAHIVPIVLIMAACALLFWIPSIPFYVIVACGLGIIVFGIVAILMVWRLLSRSPVLTINHEGIVENASLIATGLGLIPWQDIVGTTSIGPKSRSHMFSRRFLVLVTRNTKVLKQRQNLLKRLILATLWLGQPMPIRISESLLPIRVEELQAEILRYREAHMAHKHVEQSADEG